jgi:predicted RNA-binding Zn-ribbon protein involved in translation (DUF1610 family)
LAELFSLICPTCGASLQIAGEHDRFQCGHCGNQYLLEDKVREMDESERTHLAPVVTYTNSMGQWLHVAEYDLILHQVEHRKVNEEQVLYIEAEYENKTGGPIKYRHDQWVVFDTEGHTFEPAKDFTHAHLYGGDKIYLGMTRVLNPGMRLKGWLAFVLPSSIKVEYVQFSGGAPIKTVEFRIKE